MRSLCFLVLGAGLLVGCSSSRYDRQSRSYPASARVESDGGQNRYVVCHKGKNTRTLPEPAVRAHLNHGDRFGSCDRDRRRDDRREDRRNRRSRRNGRN